MKSESPYASYRKHQIGAAYPPRGCRDLSNSVPGGFSVLNHLQFMDQHILW